MITDMDGAVYFTRGYLGSGMRRLVEDWSDLMGTTEGRAKALERVALAATVLEMGEPTLIEWVNAVIEVPGGDCGE